MNRRAVAAAASFVLVVATICGLVLARGGGEGSARADVKRHAPSTAAYAFQIPSDYTLLEYHRPGRPEGSPFSLFRSPKGEFIAASWYGTIPLHSPGANTVQEIGARVRGALDEEQRGLAESVRRKGLTSSAILPAPTPIRVLGLPAERYFIRRTEISGLRTETELYVVYKGKTPFGLGCRRPVEAKDAEQFWALCRRVLASVRLGRAPITG